MSTVYKGAMRHVIFDLETTGLHFSEGHRIIEIGAVELIDFKRTYQDFHVYVNPERDVPVDAYNVHGISTRFLADKMVFNNTMVGPLFCDYIKDSVLVAHNGIIFDIPFLNFELRKAGLLEVSNPVIDTYVTAKMKFPGSHSSLDSLCRRYNIDLDSRREKGHGALLDSELLADVFIHLSGQNVRSFELIGGGEKEKIKLVGKAKKRKKKLPSRITKEELDAHNDFIENDISNSMWKSGALDRI